MPLTSTWNIWTPDDTDNYDFIVDSAATAQTVDDALTQVETDLTANIGAGANFYIGTAAARAAFTTAPEGANWQDTDGMESVWRFSGSSWVLASPEVLVKSFDTSAGVGSGATVTTLAIPARDASQEFHITTMINMGNAGASATLFSASLTSSAGTLTVLKSGVISLAVGAWGDFSMIHKLALPAGTGSTLTLLNGATASTVLRGSISALRGKVTV